MALTAALSARCGGTCEVCTNESATYEYAVTPRDPDQLANQVTDVHKDAFNNILENGNNVVLTQALNAKGASFTAAKGTIVKKIRMVSDNTAQIEGRINDQTILILTKFVKKG
jgi:uncharacterized Zn ribbon protein